MALNVPWRQGGLALIIFLLRVMRSMQRGGRYQREEKERVTPRQRITGFAFAFCLEWPPTWSRPKDLLICFAQSNLSIEWHVPTAILPFSWGCRAFCPLVMTTPLPSPTQGSGRTTKAPIIGLVSVLSLTFKFQNSEDRGKHLLPFLPPHATTFSAPGYKGVFLDHQSQPVKPSFFFQKSMSLSASLYHYQNGCI